MERKVSTLLFLWAAVSLIATLTDCWNVSEDYITRTTRFANTDYFDGVKQLKEVNLEGANSPELVLDRLQYFPVYTVFGHSSAYIQSLRDLADANGDCEGLPYNFLKIYCSVQASTIIKHKQAVLDFMLFYGKQRLNSCARKEIKRIKDTILRDEALDKAVKFFKQVVFLDENASDKNLQQELSLRNAADTKWNVDWLVREYGFRIGHLSAFETNCHVVCRLLHYALDTINLADQLDPQAGYFKEDIKLGALNEIRRICLEAYRQRRDFRRNLNKQIGPKQMVLNPIVTALGIKS